jgi:hypothetical protein
MIVMLAHDVIIIVSVMVATNIRVTDDAQRVHASW